MRSRCHHAFVVGLTAAVCFSTAVLLAGCQQDEPIGHTSETTKKVVETPTEKTTTTETRQKDTRYVR